MPIISYQKEQIFFSHIPKTGGTAIELFFKQTAATIHLKSRHLHGKSPLKFPCSPQHFQAEVINLLFKKSFFKYKFAIVRHPVDRLLSEYRMRMRSAIKTGKTIPTFEDWMNTVFEHYQEDHYFLDNHLRPQFEFVDERTEVFRYENGLENAIKFALETLRIDVEEIVLPRKNVGAKIEVSINNSVLENIFKFYQNDFVMFGYDFAPTNT